MTDEKIIKYTDKQMFDHILTLIEYKCRNADAIKRKTLYSSFRRMISLDLTYSTIATYAYKKNSRISSDLEPPVYYYHDNARIMLDYKIEAMHFNDTFFIGCAYQDDKWQKHLFRNDDLNINLIDEGLPNYFPLLNLFVVGSGNKHRLTEAYLNRPNSFVKAKVIEDEILYDKIYTDGESWINKEDDMQIDYVKNYKLALIFALRQKELTMP